ncbi:fungal-specific transcription factor domain-containing protein [Xylariales sp. PMI_506]|nr:fungal-specific transcription factor domain-containing protein [Xylariales sp. PMI_506]
MVTMKRRGNNGEGEEGETEASSAPKRQRVSRACDQCRAAREKCDGIQPLCFPCASQNRRCTWEEPKKKRGVQTGYIRTLEIALGWIFDKIPGTEEALQDLLTHEGGQGRALLAGKDTAGGNRLHRKWRKSAVYQEIDHVLSGGDVTLTKTEKPSPSGEESDSGDEADQIPKIKTSSVPPLLSSLDLALPSKHTSGKDPPKDSGQESSDDHTYNSAIPEASNQRRPPEHGRREGRRPELLKLPPNSWRLLDIYFSYTHCWFPILEKTLVHKACWSYPHEGLDVADDQPVSAAHAELWAALAVAAYQDEANQRESGHGVAEGCKSADEMYRAARSLLPQEDGRFEARHVCALLLLSLVNIGRRQLNAAWLLVGVATRIALSSGLHLASVSESNRRPNYAYMACFILDTLVSTRINQPPHLRAEDVQHQALPSGEEDQDEWETWNPCSGFGSPSSQGVPSRSPAHSISSFGSFFGIHRAHSTFMFPRKGGSQPEEPYLMQVQRILAGNRGSGRPFGTFIISGGAAITPVPSIYLIRLTFLCCGSKTQQILAESVPSAVLQCVEEHVLHFGVSSIPPLFSTYMALVNQQYDLDMLGPDVRARWKKMEAAIDSVWTTAHEESRILPGSKMSNPLERAFSGMHSSSSSQVYHSGSASMNNYGSVQQLPTPSSHYAGETPTEHPPPIVVRDMYSEPATSSMLNYPGATSAGSSSGRSRQSLNFLNLGAGGSGTARFDLGDLAPAHYHANSRPSFGSATFDYDAILDDIASLDRTDRLGSDPQFMTNLGFAPGSDLADLLTQDFSGIQ